MKRSEMLDSITSELQGNFPLAETILTLIEDLGMLPPPIKEEFMLFQGLGKDLKNHPNLKWEPEDEE